jgi:ferredoxin
MRDRTELLDDQQTLPPAESHRPADDAAVVQQAARSSAPIPAACKGQLLEVTSNELTHPACVGATSISQSGGVRVYRVESQSGPGYSLRIEAAGSIVLSAALGIDGAKVFRCDGKACAGIVIGRHDVEGARIISLNQVVLTNARDEQMTVNGRLQTLPEDRVPGLACTGQGVSIITSDGSSMMFCPKGGAGFEIGNDGGRTYRFTNLDGASLLIAVDQEHRARRVEYQGDVTLACASSTCGVQISAANSAGERTFTFAGTTLLEVSAGQSNAVLNGMLIVPPL